MHSEEVDLIRRIARDMGLSFEGYESCKAVYRKAIGDANASPYDILGVAADATDQDVRRARRRLVREYHPDVLYSKGMPDELLAFAEQKLILINDAWSAIKAERGRLAMPE